MGIQRVVNRQSSVQAALLFIEFCILLGHNYIIVCGGLYKP